MEQVNLNSRERVTVRRAIIKGLADAAHRTIGGPMDANIKAAADAEVPGLVKGPQRSG